MEFDIAFMLINLVIQVVVMVPALWIVGRMLTSSQNAKFTDAIMIVVIGSVVSTIAGVIIPGIVGTLLQVVVYLYLIKKYYECSWGKAAAVAIVTVIVFVIIAAVLAVVLGVSLGGLGYY
jgi:hypothetical protein